MKFSLKDLFLKNRQIFQLIYGIILIILIPFLISINTVSIVKKYNSLIEDSIKRKALIVGQSLSISFVEYLDDYDKLQSKIRELDEKNIGIEDLKILVEEKGDFKVIAAKNKDSINKVYNYKDNSDVYVFYQYAWNQPDGSGLATDSLLVRNEDDLAEGFSIKDRIWLVSIPIYKDSERAGLLSLKLSSRVIDDVIRDNKNSSVWMLLLTIISVILFLSISVKIWDYALLYKKIKEVDKMKDEFISIASHELRTPLTAIKGYVSLMQEGLYGKINSKMNDGLRDIMLSVDRLNVLVEDLLNVSRIEQGRLKVENKPIALKPVIQEILSQLKPAAVEKNLSLVFKNSDEKIPMVIADNNRLKQVLVNLIGNSIKYTEKGKVEIFTENDNGKVRVVIADTGIGMSQEEQARLFQKFYRAQNEKTAEIVGTGLGLWITKQLVELMNGKIFVESMKGAGTRFYFTLNTDKDSAKLK